MMTRSLVSVTACPSLSHRTTGHPGPVVSLDLTA